MPHDEKLVSLHGVQAYHKPSAGPGRARCLAHPSVQAGLEANRAGRPGCRPLLASRAFCSSHWLGKRQQGNEGSSIPRSSYGLLRARGSDRSRRRLPYPRHSRGSGLCGAGVWSRSLAWGCWRGCWLFRGLFRHDPAGNVKLRLSPAAPAEAARSQR